MTFEKQDQKSHAVEAYSEALQCGWVSWRVVDDESLALAIAADNCCDMTGAIRVAQALLPGVRRIYTFCDGIEDVAYQRTGSQWIAYPQNEAATH